jgi:hypothetical protein
MVRSLGLSSHDAESLCEPAEKEVRHLWLRIVSAGRRVISDNEMENSSSRDVYEHAGYVIVLWGVSNKAIEIDHDGFQQHIGRQHGS